MTSSVDASSTFFRCWKVHSRPTQFDHKPPAWHRTMKCTQVRKSRLLVCLHVIRPSPVMSTVFCGLTSCDSGGMRSRKPQFSLLDILAHTTFVASAMTISAHFGRGLFFPTLLAFVACYRVVQSRTCKSQVRWAMFGLGVCSYLIFVPALDRYIDHLVWRVFQPPTRFQGGTMAYGCIEVGTFFLPILLHAVMAFVNGWLAINTTRVLLSIWLGVILLIVLYPK